VLARQLMVGDVSTIHLATGAYGTWAVLHPGFAGDDGRHRAASIQPCLFCPPFVPLSDESFGCLAIQAVKAGRPGLSRKAGILGARRELSIALCRDNASMCWLGLYAVTGASGRTLLYWLDRTSADVG
jgi:hypothetical protein